MSEINISNFFYSSLHFQNRFQSFKSFLKWFDSIYKSNKFYVEKVPLEQIDKWHFDDNKCRLYHESGRFFSVEGINVKTNFGDICEWDQPIINQPEIGILGIITKVFDGIRYFLMQAKIEPGNINILQISPTLQATKSNFSRAHNGKIPLYFEFFNGEKQVKVLVDQLQTEQGSSFLRKRNRNIIIEIFDDIEIYDDFCWLTLAELKLLLQKDNILNMDSRSVLSTVSLVNENIISDINNANINKSFSINGYKLTDIGMDYLHSFISSNTLYSIDDIISWYTQQKVTFELNVAIKPLSKLHDWTIGKDSIFSENKLFSVIGVKVDAGTREVISWMQPIITYPNTGLVAFIVKKINGILHFLIQAIVEPGNRDIIELSPTISCSNYAAYSSIEIKPFMFDELTNSDNIVHFDSLQSEEGGRFYQVQNRNMIVELINSQEQQLPVNYIWMTLRQMQELMRFGMFNIEARSLISMIKFF